jgi:hypothetical protein
MRTLCVLVLATLLPRPSSHEETRLSRNGTGICDSHGFDRLHETHDLSQSAGIEVEPGADVLDILCKTVGSWS